MPWGNKNATCPTSVHLYTSQTRLQPRNHSTERMLVCFICFLNSNKYIKRHKTITLTCQFLCIMHYCKMLMNNNVKLCFLVQGLVCPTASSFAQWCLKGQHPYVLIQQELLCRDLLSYQVKQVATWTEVFCFSDIVDCLFLTGGHYKAGACGLIDGTKDLWLERNVLHHPSARLSVLQLGLIKKSKTLNCIVYWKKYFLAM